VDLVEALAWPLTLLVIVLLFFRPLKKLFARDDVRVKAGPGGIDLSASNRKAAATALVKASQDKPDATTDVQTANTEIAVAASGLEGLPDVPRVLWVDDRPSNNRYERATLHALGMFVELGTSTEDALAKVAAGGGYDVIISDMGRPPDAQAGYTLLEELRRLGVITPFVIYASSRDPVHFDESVRRGAVGCTNRPSELIELVTNALRSRRRR